MGMAASQARLLSITSRISDNEQLGQQVSYAKESLSDKTDQITLAYNEALKATKLQIMTGYANGAGQYTDISFKMLASPQVVENLGKQYCVTDTKGRVLVGYDIAKAFLNAHGSLNIFLGMLGQAEGGPYTLSDVDPSKKANTNPSEEIEAKIHEAWDNYYNSIGKTFTDENTDSEARHSWQFGFVEMGDDIGEGYATLTIGTDTQVINFEGTNEKQLELYNYAMAITESYYSVGTNIPGQRGFAAHDFTTAKTQYDKNNTLMVNYYQNLYNKMLSSGFYTYTNTLAEANADSEHFIYINAGSTGASSRTTDGSPLEDANTFEKYLQSGELLLETFSSTDGEFVSTSLSTDICVQEVKDDTKIAQAQAKYEEDMTQLQRLDSRYDLQLKQIDTEHNTLQTEYQSVQNIIKKNIEKSFTTFG